MSVYRPENYPGPLAQDATVGVKFSHRTFLMKSFLDLWKIPYTEEDLEVSPFGLGIYLEKDETNNQKRAQQEKTNT